MKKSSIVLSVMLISALFVSCKKESNEPSIGIEGTYSFVSMDVSSSISQEYTNESGTTKTITESDYTTEDNNGTITIAATTMASNNLSYSVSTTSTASMYVDGTLMGTFDAPFDFSVPATSSSATYRVISADSIYFDGGSMLMGGVSQDVIPSGAKIRMEGNLLYMTQTVKQSKTQTISGIPMKTDIDAIVVAKLQKQ
jgi:hypothetical protein